MFDIKNEFYRVAMDDLDRREKHMSYNRKLEIINFRWELFVSNFVQSKDVLNYAVGNWTTRR